tara:strand:- start:2696 stop:2845 length:150 start_codon:yes stop_codon:yes gene_type:complete
METERRDEVETEIDRGVVSFLSRITELGLVAFFVVVILGFANMLANNIS